MKETRLLMGMPVTVEILDAGASFSDFSSVFSYLAHIDTQFSTYKSESEISRINRGEITPATSSTVMQSVFALAEQTKRETYGYFNIRHKGVYDPSGIVKGLAIYGAAELLWKRGLLHFFVDAGGDIQTSGREWSVGIRNPFSYNEIVKVLYLKGEGVATSGTYLRGEHIWGIDQPKRGSAEIVSTTVVGPNIVEADRFATAAFAMGEKGIAFLEAQPGLEGYMIDRNGIATFTSGFSRYTKVYV